MTKKELFTKVLTFAEVQADPEIVKGLTHEIELLENRTSSKKPTAIQKQNAEYAKVIVEELKAHPHKLYSATEIVKAIESTIGVELSNQKVSSILAKLAPKEGTGELKRTIEKRRAYFSYEEV